MAKGKVGSMFPHGPNVIKTIAKPAATKHVLASHQLRKLQEVEPILSEAEELVGPYEGGEEDVAVPVSIIVGAHQKLARNMEMLTLYAR